MDSDELRLEAIRVRVLAFTVSDEKMMKALIAYADELAAQAAKIDRLRQRELEND